VDEVVVLEKVVDDMVEEVVEDEMLLETVLMEMVVKGEEVVVKASDRGGSGNEGAVKEVVVA
jgi:hypothetical protein